tara:strand:+ start:3057 stop:3317 length:261 start_codon:yes stop_codon:yes gene_type:complete
MPYSEDKPITTQDVINQIKSKNLDKARDSVQDLLYKKSAEAIADKKVDIAKGIGKSFDPHANVIDAPVTQEVDTPEPISQETTSEE